MASSGGMMRYRILEPSEWDRLSALIEDKDSIPHPLSASVAVAEDDSGNIAGLLFLQIALHMEPLILKSPKVSFEKLHNTLMKAVHQHKGLHIYCFSDKEIIDRMAYYVGMKPLPYKIFEQVVE
jgi:hypothetical protein